MLKLAELTDTKYYTKLVVWSRQYNVLVYLPTYLLELNPVELVFNKLKIVLKRAEYRHLLRCNLNDVFEGLKQITSNDMRDLSLYWIH